MLLCIMKIIHTVGREEVTLSSKMKMKKRRITYKDACDRIISAIKLMLKLIIIILK